MAAIPPQAPDDTQDGRHITQVGDLRGGRNGADPAASLDDTQCAEAINVDWNNGNMILGRRRWGTLAIDMSGSTAANTVDAMHRHVPNSDSTAAELWTVDVNERVNRLSRGFLSALGNTFSAANNSGVWTCDGTLQPSLFLQAGGSVLIDSNTYTVTSVNTSAFTTQQLNGVTYAHVNVAPQGAVWTQPTMLDSITGAAIQTQWSTLDNKLVIANEFTTDTFQRTRLHMWDGSTVRRAGIGPSIVAPVPSDNGSGMYANTARYYRTRWVEKQQLTDWAQALAVTPIASKQIILTINGVQHVSGFGLGATANITFTVSANLTAVIYAAAGGGGGGGTTGADGAAGSGGGSGATTSAFPVQFISGKTYTLHVGAGGAGSTGTGANGDQTFIHDDTDSTYVLRLDGGKAGAHNTTGGAGGAVLTGTGVAGSTGGTAGGVNGAGSPGAGLPGGAGSGGGGGGVNPVSGSAGTAQPGGSGGESNGEAGQAGVAGVNSYTTGGSPGTPSTPNTLQDNSTVNRFGLAFGAGDGQGGGTNWNGLRPVEPDDPTTGAPEGGSGDPNPGANYTVNYNGLTLTFADPWSEANTTFGGGYANWNAWRATLNNDGPANPTIIAGNPGTPPTSPTTIPATYPVGGRGGAGGGVLFSNSGISGAFGAGGYGGAGATVSESGGAGQDGVCIIAFSPESTQGSLGGFNTSLGSHTWTPGGVLDPSEFLLIGDSLLIDGNTYTVATVNSTVFTTNEAAGNNYTSIAVDPHTSIVVRRSEPSPSQSFTPSGSGGGVAVSHPFPPGDGETHWELEASMDDATYYLIGTFPKTYATYYDQLPASNSNYFDAADGVPSDTVGTYNIPLSYKFVAGDQNRMLGFGSWNPNDVQNRVEFSAVRGDLNIGDLERVPLGNYRDLDENDSGEPTGLVGPIFSAFFAFKISEFWVLTPTGNTTNPFTANAVSKTVGALPRTVVVGEDEFGNPALYWMSPYGPYRYIVNVFGQGRLEYIGHGIKDRIDGTLTQIEYTTTDDPLSGVTLFFNHSVYYPALRQVWFTILTDTDTQFTRLVYNIGRSSEDGVEYQSGWSIHGGPSVQAKVSTIFSRVIGADMSHDLCPYVAPRAQANAQIWRCDVPDVNTDAGTPYMGYIKSKAFTSGLHRNISIGRSYVHAYTANAVISQTIVGDYGLQISTSNASIAASMSGETETRQRFDDSGMAGIGAAQFIWGDSAPTDQHWEIAEVVFEILPKEIV